MGPGCGFFPCLSHEFPSNNVAIDDSVLQGFSPGLTLACPFRGFASIHEGPLFAISGRLDTAEGRTKDDDFG